MHTVVIDNPTYLNFTSNLQMSVRSPPGGRGIPAPAAETVALGHNTAREWCFIYDFVVNVFLVGICLEKTH